MKTGRVLLCAAVIALLASTTFAYPVRFQQGASNQFFSSYSGALDTYIDVDHPDLNYGSAPELFMCGNDDGYHWYQAHALMRFTVTSLRNTYVQSARLYLYVNAYNSMPVPPEAPLGYTWAGCQPMFSQDYDWIAGTANGQVQANSSCFNYKRYNTRMWTYDPFGQWWSGDWYNFQPTGREANGYHEIVAEIPASLVTSWAWATAPNAGLRMYFGDSFSWVVSSDSPYQALRPVLEVDIVPEPASMAGLLMGLGGLLVTRKKR